MFIKESLYECWPVCNRAEFKNIPESGTANTFLALALSLT